MKVDHVLILAAGKGTRMGEIGKELPKVQWPIFEKSILELEVDYAKTLAPNAKIYINYFNYKEKMQEYFKSHKAFNEVELLEENEVLDIGGAVHNLAKTVNYCGNLLIINSDQFLYFSKDILDSALKSLENNTGVLLSYNVNSDDLYNALNIEKDLFKGVTKNSELERSKTVQTYTGISLWDLAKLEKDSGESNFFKSVADHNRYQIKVHNLDQLEYWDFGTINRYYESMFSLLSIENSEFKNFLITNKALDPAKLKVEGYHSNSGINLTSEYIEDCKKSICLENANTDLITDKPTIIRHNLQDHFDKV